MNDEDALDEDKEVDVFIEYLEEPVNRSNPKIFAVCGELVTTKMNVLEIYGRKNTPMLEIYVISVPLYQLFFS